MSRFCGDIDPAPVFAAASVWRDRALLNDGSVFSESALWTTGNLAELVRHFVENEDHGSDDFLEKLRRQLDPVSSAAKQLAAEIQWLLWLAPDNVNVDTKVNEVAELWSWSDQLLLPQGRELLQPEALRGVGSAGRGITLHRRKELAYIIRFAHAFKALSSRERERLLRDGWALADWLQTVPESNQRQFRHMLLYLLFPDEFERVFSGSDRKDIVQHFAGKRRRDVQSQSALQLDRELLEIRKKNEGQYPGVPLDYYVPPLAGLWKEAQSKVWLLIWNPDNFPWESLEADRSATHAGQGVTARWSCANGGAKPGDLAYLVRTGSEPRGAIAVGNVVREPYDGPHWNPSEAAQGATRQYIDVEFTRIQDPTKGDAYVSAEQLKLLSADQLWAPPGSGIEIKARAAAALAKAWKESVEKRTLPRVSETVATYQQTAPAEPQNIIYYGPPGTGKTRRIAQLRAEYTSSPQAQSKEAWLAGELADASWFDVLVAVLWDLGRPSKVGKIVAHPFFAAKLQLTGQEKYRTNRAWAVLQLHANASSTTVRLKERSEPLVFDKDGDSQWFLMDDWAEQCPEQLANAKRWKAGPASASAQRRYEFVTFHQSYGYEDFVEGIRPELDETTKELSYSPAPGVFKRICRLAKKDPQNRYALFIDEINRGNVAKILGELITLIEPDKRATYDADGVLTSGLELTLPYSKELFGVPANLDLYGTMNTADRSIALLDTALRRRFRFIELMPDSAFIGGADGHGRIDDGQGGEIDLRRLLSAINLRVTYLLNRDMQIGHAYFMPVRTFDALRRVMLNQVVPLLQEYFYEDWRRIQLVLADIGEDDEPNEPQIVVHELLLPERVFGIERNDCAPARSYRIAAPESLIPDAFRKIYESPT
ncbi:AAA family ATPase [Steroidobacter flavus]|uniref:AAA family ATPase n=1 Tax=Steroidobacter flavus TaxID=1842136 RepID=A0ABV8STN3_9GAMM